MDETEIQRELDAARERLRGLEERFRYTLELDGTARAILATEQARVGELEGQLRQLRGERAQAEAAELRSRQERDRARNEEIDNARRRLPNAVRAVEEAGQGYAKAVSKLVQAVAKALPGVEEAADALDDARRELGSLAAQAQEINKRGIVPKPSLALHELLSALQVDFGDPVPDELAERLRWIAHEASQAGRRDPVWGLPQGGPSIARHRERLREAEERRRKLLEERRLRKAGRALGLGEAR